MICLCRLGVDSYNFGVSAILSGDNVEGQNYEPSAMDPKRQRGQRATDRATERPLERATERRSERLSDRSSERSSDRAIERSSKRSSKRSGERPIEASDRASDRARDRTSERSRNMRVHAYTCTRVHLYAHARVKRMKRRFLENTYKPIISDVQTTLKREDVNMQIQNISPGQDLETQLQKQIIKII